MSSPTRLSGEVDRLLCALQPVCILLEEHALVDTNGRTSLANLLRRYCEAPGRADFFGLNLHDFQVITIGLGMMSRDFNVVERSTTTLGAYLTVLGGAGAYVMPVLDAAEKYNYGTADMRRLAANLKEALLNLKTLCSRMMRHCTVRSKILYRDRREAREVIQHEELPSTLDDLFGESGELTEQGTRKLAAFLTYYGDVENDVSNLFRSLRQCMVPRDLLVSSKGNVYKSVRPLPNEALQRILPLRVFDGSTQYLTNLDGLCVQATGVRTIDDTRRIQLEPVSSRRYEDLMGKVEKGEVELVSYLLMRTFGVGRAITAQHLLEQRLLDMGAPDLRNRIHNILSTNTSTHLRIEAILEAVKEAVPATAEEQLHLNLLCTWVRNVASGGNVDTFLSNIRTWKLQEVIDGGIRVRVDNRNFIMINCNEMVRGGLEEGWVQQSSQLQCSLITGASGGVQVRELTSKTDVFNVIRTMGGIGWSENALQTLNNWMRLGERWNKRRFVGSGGFPMERFEGNYLLPPSEHYVPGEQSRMGVASGHSDTEDVEDLVNISSLK